MYSAKINVTDSVINSAVSSGENKNVILVVDDTPMNIRILNELLHKDYLIRVAVNGETALKLVRTDPRPDMILLDIMMPGMDGYEVCKNLKSHEDTKNIPIIFVTAMSEENDEAKGLDLGAVDYITKPFRPRLVLSRVKNHLELKRHRDNLAALVQEKTKELSRTKEATIESLASLAETRDPETGGHIRRTQNYVRILAERARFECPEEWNFTDEDIDLLFRSAPLHDIGKVGVSDAVLLKPGKLTDEEFEQMKLHTVYGYKTLLKAEENLGENSFLRLGAEIALAHHEKWDGTGYPNALGGKEIPISGRIMAIADVYDALISKRVYKAPFTHSKAVEIIKEGRDKHFDPVLVDCFLLEADNFRNTAIEYADYDEEKLSLQQ